MAMNRHCGSNAADSIDRFTAMEVLPAEALLAAALAAEALAAEALAAEALPAEALPPAVSWALLDRSVWAATECAGTSLNHVMFDTFDSVSRTPRPTPMLRPLLECIVCSIT
jgi:hypothetical protein